VSHEDKIRRRAFLAGLTSCAACSGALAAEWNYNDHGPREWPKLDPAYSVCAAGTQQSPVDLDAGVQAMLPQIRADWHSAKSTIWNNGHTIQVVVPEGSFLGVGSSAPIPLAQFHFHTPGEHAIAGKRAAIEAHFVHQRKSGPITVLAVLLNGGGRNAEFSTIMRAAPRQAGDKIPSPSPLDPIKLLPPSLKRTWRYSGSLTTPPCSETVDWIVCDEPIAVDDADIARFRAIYSMNARPPQPVNRRYLLRSQ
jgi:carbonic anhydrase